MTTILRIDASARTEKSTTRQLTDDLVSHLVKMRPSAKLLRRDLAHVPPTPISDDWVSANFTDDAIRSEEQKAVLAGSDQMIAELEAADILVIGVPIYNFSIPASLKAWIDLVVRPARTFRYTHSGPVGLLTEKKAFLLVASGGVPVGADTDCATRYMRLILAFIGITDLEIFAADQQRRDSGAMHRAACSIGEIEPWG